MVKRTTQRKRSTKRTARTKKAMTGGFTLNNVVKKLGFKGKSPRTLEELANSRKGSDSVMHKLVQNITSGNMLGHHFAFIGGIKNPTTTIEPIDLAWLANLDTANYITPLTQLKNIGEKVGVFIQKNNGSRQVIPVSSLSNIKVKQSPTGVHGKYRKEITGLSDNNENLISIASTILTRDLVKDNNEQHRSSTSYNKNKPIIYLYVIGKKIEETNNQSTVDTLL